jgi:GT2 family glycosyltransferase
MKLPESTDALETVETDSLARGSLPPTSLIICSRNRPQLLTETVESILRGDELPTELIIIDQSNAAYRSPATQTVASACEIRCMLTASVGVSRARNEGIAAATYGILAFTDDDILVTPSWFGSLVRVLLQAGPCSVVTGQVRPTEAEIPGGFAPSTKVAEILAVYEGRVGTDPLFTGNMAMYRDTIGVVGGFDERLGPGSQFPSSEDNDFGFRLLELGYRIIYVPEAVVYHRAWRSDRDYLRLRWNYGVGQGGFYAKHLSLRDQYMLSRLVRHIGHYVFMFRGHVRHQRLGACGDVIYVLGLLCGVVRWFLSHRRTQ